MASSSASSPARSPTAVTPVGTGWEKGPKQRELEEVSGIMKFIEEVDGYTPTVPEAVVQQYLQLGGSSTTDPRILKLVALATDKFLAGLAKDTKDLGALRVGDKRAPPPLDMQDLTESLRSRGVKITKPTASESSE